MLPQCGYVIWVLRPCTCTIGRAYSRQTRTFLYFSSFFFVCSSSFLSFLVFLLFPSYFIVLFVPFLIFIWSFLFQRFFPFFPCVDIYFSFTVSSYLFPYFLFSSYFLVLFVCLFRSFFLPSFLTFYLFCFTLLILVFRSFYLFIKFSFHVTSFLVEPDCSGVKSTRRFSLWHTGSVFKQQKNDKE
jgi:hypothetical protein